MTKNGWDPKQPCARCGEPCGGEPVRHGIRSDTLETFRYCSDICQELHQREVLARMRQGD